MLKASTWYWFSMSGRAWHPIYIDAEGNGIVDGQPMNRIIDSGEYILSEAMMPDRLGELSHPQPRSLSRKIL